ncbi:response regulator [Phenylobacterium sp.]|uniref:response regulator n=1 Tax=Phenylobacterium sp. TaxID=1871053 RepID=UPI0011F4D1AD|nr:response regulator [Phenylobacterium sp.]THD63872.1 MAG: response regulator [Phenylobacterium sp.]
MADAIRASGAEVGLIIQDSHDLHPVTGSLLPELARPSILLGWNDPLAVETSRVVEDNAPSSDNPGLRVLCAEDNPTNQQVLKIFLKMASVSCTMVANGAEAVAAWEHEPWDMILMDILMPVMDGLAATRAIRALEAQNGRPRTPILAVTANVMPDQIAGYLAAEMDAVVSKPVSAPLLFSEMAAALDTPYGALADAAAVAERRLAPVLG